MEKKEFSRNTEIEDQVISIMATNCNIGISDFSNHLDILFHHYHENQGWEESTDPIELQKMLCTITQIKKMCRDLMAYEKYLCALGFVVEPKSHLLQVRNIEFTPGEQIEKVA